MAHQNYDNTRSALESSIVGKVNPEIFGSDVVRVNRNEEDSGWAGRRIERAWSTSASSQAALGVQSSSPGL
jgi:hypothetical protein